MCCELRGSEAFEMRCALLSVSVKRDLRGFADFSRGFFSVEHIKGKGDEKAFNFFSVSRLSWDVWLIVIRMSLCSEFTFLRAGLLGVFSSCAPCESNSVASMSLLL